MRKTVLSLLSVGVLLATSLSVGASTTSENRVTGSIQGGVLELTTSDPINFGLVTLNQPTLVATTGFEDSFVVEDTTGTQQGWSLNVSATPLSIVEPSGGWVDGTSNYSLPIGSLVLNPITSVETLGSGTTSEINLPTSKSVIDDGSVEIAWANSGQGMGKYSLDFPVNALELTLDIQTAKIDNVNYPSGITPYESTIRWELTQAP